jgi:hypothetical protein
MERIAQKGEGVIYDRGLKMDGRRGFSGAGLSGVSYYFLPPVRPSTYSRYSLRRTYSYSLRIRSEEGI